MRRLLYIAVIVALIVVGVLFGAINQQITELHLLIISVQLRVVDIALIFLLLGMLLGSGSLLTLLLFCGGLGAAGFFLPDALTWNAGLKRQESIQKTLPDALGEEAQQKMREFAEVAELKY